MLKKIGFYILIVVCILLISPGIFATSSELKAVITNFKLILNGNTLDKEVVAINSYSYLPVRAIGDALGLEVNWDSTTETINLRSQETGNEGILKETYAQMLKKNEELRNKLSELQDKTITEEIRHKSASLNPAVKVQSGDIKSVLSINTIRSVVKKKIEGSVSIGINVDTMANTIYSDLVKKFGVEYLYGEAELENSIIDSLTNRVGVTGLFDFAKRSNAILEKEWGIIYDGLGISNPNANTFGIGDCRYYDLVCYETDGSGKVNMSLHVYDNSKTAFGEATKTPKSFKLQVYKQGAFFPTVEYKCTTDTNGSTISEKFTINSPGIYFIKISATFMDILSPPDIRCSDLKVWQE